MSARRLSLPKQGNSPTRYLHPFITSNPSYPSAIYSLVTTLYVLPPFSRETGSTWAFRGLRMSSLVPSGCSRSSMQTPSSSELSSSPELDPSGEGVAGRDAAVFFSFLPGFWGLDRWAMKSMDLTRWPGGRRESQTTLRPEMTGNRLHESTLMVREGSFECAGERER